MDSSRISKKRLAVVLGVVVAGSALVRLKWIAADTHELAVVRTVHGSGVVRFTVTLREASMRVEPACECVRILDSRSRVVTGVVDCKDVSGIVTPGIVVLSGATSRFYPIKCK